MDVQKIKRKPNGRRRSILISIRISPAISKWLKDNEYSPTGIFYESIRDLGFKDGDENE